MKKVMYILSGIPGSGKSHLAYELSKGLGVICSADAFMVNENSAYEFKPEKLGYVHKTCQAKAASCMKAGMSPIVVDNTNTTYKEMEPYILLAATYQYDVVFMEPNTPWKYNIDECFKRNTHNVPREKLEQMLKRLVDLEDAKRHFQSIYPSLNIVVEKANGQEVKV